MVAPALLRGSLRHFVHRLRGAEMNEGIRRFARAAGSSLSRVFPLNTSVHSPSRGSSETPVAGSPYGPTGR